MHNRSARDDPTSSALLITSPSLSTVVFCPRITYKPLDPTHFSAIVLRLNLYQVKLNASRLTWYVKASLKPSPHFSQWLTHPLPFSPRPALLPPLSNSLNELTTAEEFDYLASHLDFGRRATTTSSGSAQHYDSDHQAVPDQTNFGQRLATNSSSVENPTPYVKVPINSFPFNFLRSSRENLTSSPLLITSPSPSTLLSAHESHTNDLTKLTFCHRLASKSSSGQTELSPPDHPRANFPATVLRPTPHLLKFNPDLVCQGASPVLPILLQVVARQPHLVTFPDNLTTTASVDHPSIQVPNSDHRFSLDSVSLPHQYVSTSQLSFLTSPPHALTVGFCFRTTTGFPDLFHHSDSTPVPQSF
ncbi:hypothetical protein PGTUg99_000457 [Puccinia graminis f. sp. tritici]|uniref:Uncharacterized protein n=1 Tax=Puccinia graminis f. sp. tritici TaxID=56615 RepID=A0A5B0SF15_PUCGR|nr:hypothetical protein PGTUg99_000457 [Puccinia graminis f. sp. tritici]